jgi:hypothetical protein
VSRGSGQIDYSPELFAENTSQKLCRMLLAVHAVRGRLFVALHCARPAHSVRDNSEILLDEGSDRDRCVTFERPAVLVLAHAQRARTLATTS